MDYKKELLEEYLECKEKYGKNIVKLPFDSNNIYNMLKHSKKYDSTDIGLSLKYEISITWRNELILKLGNFGPLHTEILLIGFKTMMYVIHDMIIIYPISKEMLIDILEKIEAKIIRGFSVAGELVGIIDATSLSAVLTQMTLNTFHSSGVGAVQDGMSAIKRQLSISTEYMGDSTIRIFIEKNKSSDTVYGDIIKEFHLLYLRNVINKVDWIIDEEFPNNSVIKEDRKHLKGIPKLGNIANNCLRFELNTDKLYEYKINIYDIAMIIRSKFDIFHPIPLGENVIRIYGDSNNDNITKNLKNIEDVRISGIDNVNGVTAGVFSVGKEVIFFTKGTNMARIYNIDNIDFRRTMSNDVAEVYDLFGIEAARKVFMNNLIDICNQKGAYIAVQHFETISDITFNMGIGAKVQRSGLDILSDSEYHQRISFEEPRKNLLDSALYGYVDHMKSISSNSAIGQIGPYSTGLCEILK